jgi:hypothetical protein
MPRHRYGPLAWTTYDIIMRVSTTIETRSLLMNYPSTQAIMREAVSAFSGSNLAEPSPLASLLWWTGKAQELLRGCNDYFKAKVMNELGPVLNVFKAFRVVNPERAKIILQSPDLEAVCTLFDAELRVLKELEIITTSKRVALPAELRTYKDVITAFMPLPGNTAISEMHDHLMSFWKLVGTQLPEWTDLASHSLLYLPSSAPVERVFSILKRVYGDSQMSMLEETVESSCMLIYNNRRPK